MQFPSGPVQFFLSGEPGRPDTERKAQKTGPETAGPDRFAEPAVEPTGSANRINGMVFSSGYPVTGHRYHDPYDPFPEDSRPHPWEPARVSRASARITVSITIPAAPAGGVLPPERTRPMDFLRKRLLNVPVALVSGRILSLVKTERSAGTETSFAKHPATAPARPCPKSVCTAHARVRHGPAHFTIRCPAGPQEPA